MREMLAASATRLPRSDRSAWKGRCADWKRGIPSFWQNTASRRAGSAVYNLAEVLSQELSPDDYYVSGSSGSGIELVLFAYRVKPGQRIFQTTALGAMGFGIAASIGVCLAGGRKSNGLRRRGRRLPVQHPGARNRRAAGIADQVFRAQQQRLRLDPRLAERASSAKHASVAIEAIGQCAARCRRVAEAYGIATDIIRRSD